MQRYRVTWRVKSCIEKASLWSTLQTFAWNYGRKPYKCVIRQPGSVSAKDEGMLEHRARILCNGMCATTTRGSRASDRKYSRRNQPLGASYYVRREWWNDTSEVYPDWMLHPSDEGSCRVVYNDSPETNGALLFTALPPPALKQAAAAIRTGTLLVFNVLQQLHSLLLVHQLDMVRHRSVKPPSTVNSSTQCINQTTHNSLELLQTRVDNGWRSNRRGEVQCTSRFIAWVTQTV